MQRSTFTVLVTIEHDPGRGVSPSRVGEIIQTALEEGTSVSGGFYSAQVDAFRGRMLAFGGRALPPAEEVMRFTNILPLHDGTDK